MMRFTRANEPTDFDDRCRHPGLKWLKKHRNYDRPRDYWSAFEHDLYRAFDGLCNYCAMAIPKGEIDHFIPISKVKGTRRESLIYEWSNFRYCEAYFNQRKSNHPALDPFRVQDDWFRILLPSLQLILTEVVPVRIQKKAEFTIERLGLRDGEVVIRYRRQWFELYQNHELLLEGLRRRAPLIARAVDWDLAKGIDWRN